MRMRMYNMCMCMCMCMHMSHMCMTCACACPHISPHLPIQVISHNTHFAISLDSTDAEHSSSAFCGQIPTYHP